MVLNWFKKSLLERKVVVYYYEPGRDWQEINAKLIYDKNDKRWYLNIRNEKIPAPENIFDFIVRNNLFVKRIGTDIYSFINLKAVGEQNTKVEYPIPPSELYDAILKAQLRYERGKTKLERLLPIIMMGIAMIFVAVFLAILYSNVGQSLNTMSQNLKEASVLLSNATQEQTKLLERIAQSANVLPGQIPGR